MADPAMSLVDRLHLVMHSMGWERADLVRVSGESSSVVSQWLGKGSKVIKSIGRLEAADRIARASGFAALWIATGAGPQRPSAPPSVAGASLEPVSGLVPHIPLQRMRVQTIMAARVNAAGGLSLQSEDGNGADLAAAAGAGAFAIRVQGHALYPAVRNGAYLVCDPAATPAAGDLVLLEAGDGSLTLRELMAADGSEVTTCDVRGGERETIARADLRRVVAVVSIIPGSAWRAAA